MRKLLLGAAAVTAALLLRRRRFSLRGRVALITGGARGHGLVLARELADRGCKLVICARDEATLRTAHAELEARGAEVLAVPCDVRDRQSVAAMIASARSTFGRIDMLINNAGAIEVGPLDTMVDDDFLSSMATHFEGPLTTMRAVLDEMRARGHGHIVNVSSIGGLVPLPHLVPYTASKFALVGLSSAMGVELARDGITVTTVCPWLMRTGSPRNARFKGNAAAEYRWFTLGDTWASLRAESVARRICDAIERRERFVVVGLSARAIHLFAALFPNLYSRAASLGHRLLPAGSSTDAKRGFEVATPSVLTALSDRAAERNNEIAYIPR
jgi:short-subunit dehydrogenase